MMRGREILEKGRFPIGFGVAFLFIQGIEQLYNVRSEGSLFSNSVMSMVLFGMASYGACQMLREGAERRTWKLSALTGAVFSAMVCMGHGLNYRDTMWLREVALATLLLWPMAVLLWKSLFWWLGCHMIPTTLGNATEKDFICSWVFLFLAWGIVLLASYPGIYAYDSGNQLNQYMFGEFSAHHPLLHTWLLGITMQLGMKCFHSSQAGALLYTLLQMAVLSAILSLVLYKLQKWGIPRWFRNLALLFYGFHPANSMMALAATKDTLFAGAVVLFVLQMLEITEDPEAYFASRKRSLLFAINVLAVLAFRNNAFHMLVLFFPFFAWSFRRQWKRAVVILGGCLILHIGITGPAYQALGIEEGDPREMCSVFMQTASRAYNLVYLDLTEEEKNGFYTVLTEEGMHAYLPHFADPVKAYFNGKEFFRNPKPFLKAWCSVGRRYTKLYIDGFMSNTLGYWYPGAALPDSSGLRYLEYEANGNGAEFSVEMRPKLKWLWRMYDKIGNEAAHQKIPVVSFLFSVGTFDWILLAGMFVLWQQKRYRLLLPLLPLATYLFTLFFGPVVALRYVFPIIVCLPVIGYVILKKEKSHG